MKIQGKTMLFLMIFTRLFWSCTTEHAISSGSKLDIPGAKCIIYKTRGDYLRFVPVILTVDKSGLVSFPGITDLTRNGQLAFPTLLTDGYLLDNRGIGKDVAFLKLSYEEYVKLPSTPRAEELMKMILDDDPLLEMYDCGNLSQYPDPPESMNQLIRSGNLKHQKRLK